MLARRADVPMSDRPVESGSQDPTRDWDGRESEDTMAAEGQLFPNGKLMPEAFERSADERPGFSIRTRLMVGFLLFFVLSAGQAATTWLILARVENKIEFLVAADRYTSEIQQARRFEKNFFLYGTNLDDVEAHVGIAQAILARDEQELAAVVGQGNLNTMKRHAEDYRALISRLQKLDRDRQPDQPPAYRDIEAQLRVHGGRMVDFALNLSKRERDSMYATLGLINRVPFVFLGVLLLLALYFASFLARQMIGPLNRLLATTQRIAMGDFTPLKPARRYRDEFSELVRAINRMLHELGHREEAMVQSHKLRAVGTLTAGVAHELNNPLNNITLTAGVLEEDYEALSDPERREMARDLVEQAQRAQRIVRNLLDFAREGEQKTERLDIGKILDETIDLAGNQVRIAGVKIAKELPDNLPQVHGDRQKLCQVFLNLFLNALDAMPDGGTIALSATRADVPGLLAVRVADTGKGIPEHVLPLIFDPFFTTKTTGKGTGLGLSVSLGLVRSYGGDIQVSTRVGEGTTFTVLLPIAEVPADWKAWV
jgi:signal transduction histidine kinase